MQFQAASSGYITGVRFYKEADNTGTHTGSLWTSTGTLLATGTFTNETAQGWQELDFSTPVAVTAGTTYVASYFTSTGHYAATQGGLASAVTNGPLTALAGGGVYAYGSSNTFPTSTYNGVQLLGRRGATRSRREPRRRWRRRVRFGGDGCRGVGGAAATFSSRCAGHGVVHGEGFGREHRGRVGELQRRRHGGDVHPDQLAGRERPVRYTATVSGAQNASGTPMSGPFSWSFTHRAAGGPVPVQYLAGRDADRRGRTRPTPAR